MYIWCQHLGLTVSEITERPAGERLTAGPVGSKSDSWLTCACRRGRDVLRRPPVLSCYEWLNQGHLGVVCGVVTGLLRGLWRGLESRMRWQMVGCDTAGAALTTARPLPLPRESASYTRCSSRLWSRQMVPAGDRRGVYSSSRANGNFSVVDSLMAYNITRLRMRVL